MRIGIDIDDTVTYTFEHLQPYVAEYYGITLEEAKERNISYSTLPEEWQKRETEFGRKTYDKVILYGKAKEGAADYVAKLKEEGHEIVFITARTNRVYTDAQGISEEQLRRNNIPFDKVICTEEKAERCVEEKIDLLIDDTISHCEAAVKLGLKALVFNGKANKDKVTELARVNTWEEVYKKIGEIVK